MGMPRLTIYGGKLIGMAAGSHTSRNGHFSQLLIISVLVCTGMLSVDVVLKCIYHKNPKNSDIPKITVITLKIKSLKQKVALP